jgi:RNA polymerase sigma-70 factor (ECF subfamily)
VSESLEHLLAELRPKLHRYCARMTGSVIDGEDVLQEAMLKAVEAFPRAGPIANPEGWLFRIAHNAALDHLRRRARQNALHADEDPEMVVDPANEVAARQASAAALRTFMRLPVAQRSCVILMDVLGHTLEEIGTVIDATIPAVKAALHRGRTRLRELASEPDDQPMPALKEPERSLLAAYVARFNARDFDGIRAMLADEAKVEVVNRTRMNGREEASRYYGNALSGDDWRVIAGQIEGRPAVITVDPNDPTATPVHFAVLHFEGGRLLEIRDFRYARYVNEVAELQVTDKR